MEIEELDLNKPVTISRFFRFYENVFVKCFPKDEIGSFDAYIRIKADERLYDNEYEYHLLFGSADGEYVACFIYCWFPKIRMIAAEFACVREDFRGKGVSKKLMKYAESLHDFKWMFGEIEKENRTNLAIWKKYGFKPVPVEYRQLSLGEGRDPLDNMALCVYGKDQDSPVIPAEDVKRFIWHYYRYSQFCDNPDDTFSVKEIDKVLQ